MDLDVEIEVIETKISELRDELKRLKTRRENVKRPLELNKKIKAYEKRYPDNLNWTLDSLVKIDEDFDSWVERFGHKANGSKSTEWLMEIYSQLGYTTNNWIKWLVEVHDPRVIGTEIYKKGN